MLWGKGGGEHISSMGLYLIYAWNDKMLVQNNSRDKLLYGLGDGIVRERTDLMQDLAVLVRC